MKFIAGYPRKQLEYSAFVPNFVNQPIHFENADIDLMNGEAMRLLGELNAFSYMVPNIEYFIQMHVRKEAVKSSKIEGTQTGLDEILLKNEDIQPEKRDDWQEVQNYVESMNYAIAELQNLPLSQRLLRNAHKILLSGARGQHKMPGEIRTSQNWIGGSSLKDAFFIPPPPSELPELLSDLAKFWHNKANKIPILINAAISHYQFETIHPFLDGNGRTGRLLIVLQLIDANILDKPTLYISDFFEKNRASYYDGLSQVRTGNHIEQWVKFFLQGVIDTATKSIDTFKKIVALRQRYDTQLLSLGRNAKTASSLVLKMYANPKMNIREVSESLGLSFQGAINLVKKLEKLEILKEETFLRRNRIFALKEYIELFK
jgi:Fic family protein